MTVPYRRLILLAAVVLATAAQAQAQTQQLTLRTARQVTPSCNAADAGPVTGRVVGFYGTDPVRSASFVGCFPSVEACTRWANRLSGLYTGRLVRNDCRPG